MSKNSWQVFVTVAVCVILGVPAASKAKQAKTKGGAGQQTEWEDTFDLKACTHRTTGKNRYFILIPGRQVVLAKKTEAAEEQVIITVLEDTETVDGIETRVVEEKEFLNGKLKEVSRNFFTICKEHGDVFYHGEDVEDYKDGKVVGHGGAWRAGVKGARAGLMMPKKIKVGAKFYQEVAPNVAMDRAEITRKDAVVESRIGKFKKCLKVVETTPLEPGVESLKLYAPRIGLVFDDGLVIVQHGSNRKSPEGPVEVKAKASGSYVEVEITTTELPKEAAAKVQELYPDGKIHEVKLETRQDGREVYAIEIFIGEKQYDVEVTKDGTVLRNEAE